MAWSEERKAAQKVRMEEYWRKRKDSTVAVMEMPKSPLEVSGVPISREDILKAEQDKILRREEDRKKEALIFENTQPSHSDGTTVCDANCDCHQALGRGLPVNGTADAPYATVRSDGTANVMVMPPIRIGSREVTLVVRTDGTMVSVNGPCVCGEGKRAWHRICLKENFNG